MRRVALALACLLTFLPSASATSAGATDPSGDVPYDHLDLVALDVVASGGDLTVTLTVVGFDVSQPQTLYSTFFTSGDREFTWNCNLAGDGTALQLTGCDLVRDVSLVEEDEAWLRTAPHGIGPTLATVFDTPAWDIASTIVTGSEDIAHASSTDGVDSIGFTVDIADLGLAAGDSLTVSGAGAIECDGLCGNDEDSVSGPLTVTLE